MKKFIILAISALILSVSAHASLIKSCETVVKTDESDVSMKIEVYNRQNKLEADITQEGGTLTEKVSIIENTVRAGITINSELEKLNFVERLVAHAMILTEDPILAGTQDAGLDLKLIRSAKVFIIGETDGMGLFAIVEAKNKSGKLIGSFIGGFLVSPCKAN